MATVNSVSNVDFRGDGTSTQMYSGSAPAMPVLPNTATAMEIASRINENMRKTFDRLMSAVDTWSQLRHCYEGPEQETVYAAFNDRLERISALKLAGEALFDAYAMYDASLSSDIVGRRNSYTEWAPGHVSECAAYEPYIGQWCRNQYGTAHGLWLAMGTEDDEKMAVLEEMNRLKEARTARKFEVEQIVFDFNGYRDDLARSLEDVDMEDLSEIRFETRNEATTTVESQEDVKSLMRESAAFESLGLEDAEIEQIAAEVWADRGSFQIGQFTDDQGRHWVMTAEGTMVRAGSAMDPRLNATVMRTIAEDPILGRKEIEYPGMDGRDSMTVEALVFGLNKGNEAFTEWGVAQFTGENANILGMKVNSGIIGAGLSVLSIGATAGDYKNSQAMLYPLMSSTDLDERHGRAVVVEGARTAGTVVLGSGMMFVAAAAGAPTGGVGGFIVAAVVDDVTGRVVGWIVDTVNEGQISATQDDINAMSDDELERADQ
ncbi:hypothetical protein [Citricoccus alkalitolerans]|uniref:WXG100 family type VII secretion target n=1 Tax=Citricoccus alkalitolerans TaxID=246603 RepID=A0ABV8XUH1_9MICC